jgi:uncharacterized damage-inducible protein DinB
MAMDRDAFRHHIWATRRLLDVCEGLTTDQLTTPTTGTYGGILETLQHLVGSDTWYLFVLSGGSAGRGRVDDATHGIADLHEVVEEDARGWETMLDGSLDGDADVASDLLEGGQRHATLGIRLAQVVHHGTDHRSQVCTALTALGVEPPSIDVWDYGESVGRVSVEP